MTTATRTIGPADHGRAMSFDEFIESDFQDGWLYELARGVIDVTEVPGLNHGETVMRLAGLFHVYRVNHPGRIRYLAGGGECRLRLPGMQSDRHPDQAAYLRKAPIGDRPWTRWVPAIAVEVVSVGGESRDYVDKREEYLRIGVTEYWIIDLAKRAMFVLIRVGDVWEGHPIAESDTYRTDLLPGLEVHPGEILGPEYEGEPEPDIEN